MELNFNTQGNEKQKEAARVWLDAETVQFVYGGSKGSAKSYTGVSLIFGDAFIYPETHYFIARKELNDLRKFTIPSIYEVFKHWGVNKSMFKYNGQDNFFELNNGSKVFFLQSKYLPSDPMFERFGSMQMTRGWCEEGGEFDEQAIANLTASCGRWNNDKYNLHSKVLITCNPTRGYLYREFYKKHKDGLLESHKKFIQALPTDNKMLSKGYLENLRRVLKPNERKRLLDGLWEFDDDPNALTTFDKVQEIFDYTKPEQLNAERYITADIAFESDKCIIIVWVGLSVVEIVEVPRDQKPETIILKKEQQYNVKRKHIGYDATGAGLYLKNYLKNAFVFHSGAKPLKDLQEFEHLKTQCYYRLAEAINDGEIRIFDKRLQEETTDELLQIKTLPKEKLEGKIKMIKKDQIKKNIGRSPDILDALAIRFVWEIKGGFRKQF